MFSAPRPHNVSSLIVILHLSLSLVGGSHLPLPILSTPKISVSVVLEASILGTAPHIVLGRRVLVVLPRQVLWESLSHLVRAHVTIPVIPTCLVRLSIVSVVDSCTLMCTTILSSMHSMPAKVHLISFTLVKVVHVIARRNVMVWSRRPTHAVHIPPTTLLHVVV